jgi:hypothetical protein
LEITRVADPTAELRGRIVDHHTLAQVEVTPSSVVNAAATLKALAFTPPDLDFGDVNDWVRRNPLYN